MERQGLFTHLPHSIAGVGVPLQHVSDGQEWSFVARACMNVEHTTHGRHTRACVGRVKTYTCASNTTTHILHATHPS